MLTALLEGLTQSEAEDALRFAMQRHPALSFAVRASDASYELAIEENDHAEYSDIVDAIVRQARPPRLRVRDAERELSELLRSIETESVKQACALFEWVLVPYLLPLGDFVDGFHASSIVPFTRGVTLTGECWFFHGRGGPFEARLALAEDGTLSELELRFGDATTAAEDRIIPPSAPDGVETSLYGYRTSMQKTGRWAFYITFGQGR